MWNSLLPGQQIDFTPFFGAFRDGHGYVKHTTNFSELSNPAENITLEKDGAESGA